MRIAVDVRPIGPTQTGIGKVTWNLLWELGRLDSSNDYFLIGQGKPTQQINELARKYPNFRYLASHTPYDNKLPYFARAIYSDQFALPRAIRQIKPDLVHFSWFNVPIKISRSFVMLIHDLYNFAEPDRYSWKFRLYYNSIVKRMAIRAARIITISKASRDDIIKFLHIPKERIDVIYLGVNHELFKQPDRPEIKRVQIKFGIRGDYIINTGGIGARKNLRALLSAFFKLVDNGIKDLCLVITGKINADIVADLKLSTERKILNDSIRFTGYVDERDLVCLYGGALALVYPSLYEGFGLPVLEAMACGTPVIASNISSLPEIAQSAALLVSPANEEEIARGILEMRRDQRLRHNLIQMGLKRCREFLWSKSAAQLLIAYQKAVDSKKV